MTMKLGFAKKALPSPVGTELCGYGYYINRICKEVLDTLYVRCIALSSGKVKSLVLSADLIGLSAELHEEVRKLIADKLGYAGKEVMIVCTHTHTGPSTNHLVGGGVMNKEYNLTVPPVFLAAAEAAVEDLSQCEGMEECCEPIEEIGYNRNIPDGPHDNIMRGLVVKRTEKAPVAIVSYPCHPVTLGPRPQASADHKRHQNVGSPSKKFEEICVHIDQALPPDSSDPAEHRLGFLRDRPSLLPGQSIDQVGDRRRTAVLSVSAVQFRELSGREAVFISLPERTRAPCI